MAGSDEPAVLGVVERFARNQGFEVIRRAGGRSMLAELPTLKVNVALVDLHSPKSGAWTCCAPFATPTRAVRSF